MSRSEKFDWPLVTINILAYNRKKEVEVTLTKILNELDYPKDKLEIIVVDNASTDGTYDMIKEKFPQVKVIRLQKNIGIAGWNCGFREGEGKYFLVLDDDAYVEGGTLKHMVMVSEREKADLISIRVVNPKNHVDFTKMYPTGLLSFWGCCALISRGIVCKLGGFDENIFIWAHELEFTIRLLSYGGKHIYCPKLTGYHMSNTNRPLSKNLLRFKLVTNLKHFVYIGAKFFGRRSAFKILLYQVIRLFFVSIRKMDFILFLKSYDLIVFFLRGLKSRSVIPLELEQLYLEKFIEFVNPLYVKLKKLKRQDFYDGFYYPQCKCKSIQFNRDHPKVEVQEIELET